MASATTYGIVASTEYSATKLGHDASEFYHLVTMVVKSLYIYKDHNIILYILYYDLLRDV